MATTPATDVSLPIANQTRFAFRLASAISSNPEYAATNAAYSPLSLHFALSLIAGGAGGATREQLVAVLASGVSGEEAEGLHALAEQVVQVVLPDASAAGGPRIAFANGVFVDASLSLKPSFKELAVGAYKADVQSADFQTKPAEAVAQVNSWVEKATAGLIEDVLPQGSVDNSTALVLANALYFKGSWHEKFDSSKTREACSTFSMGAQCKHHSCRPQRSNTFRLLTISRYLSFLTIKVETRESSPCTFFFQKHLTVFGAWQRG